MSTFERFKVEREMAKKLEERQAELSAVSQRAAALQTKVEYLKDDRGLEEEIRSRFDVAKDGEQVIILIENEKNNPSQASSVPPDSVKQDNRSWFRVFRFW